MLGPILFVLYTHPISEIVSYHSLSHHSFSDDNQLYKSDNITQLPEIIHSTQSCISDVDDNNQLQLHNDKTEMILIATKTVLNSDSVPQSINLEGSDIKFANTVRNLGVRLDPTLSFQQQISSICHICYLELHRISAIRHHLSEDVIKKLLCAFVLSRLDYCNSLLAGCPKYLLSKLQKVQNNAARLIFRTRSAHVTPLLCFILFTGYLLSRGSNTNCLCFALTLRSFLIRLPSTIQISFTFTLPPGSSALLQTSKCSEYHPSKQRPGSSYGQTETNSMFLSAILPLSALLHLH